MSWSGCSLAPMKRTVEVIDGFDLRAMSGDYRGSGSASYHPRMLLGILVYGYATGVFSSRKLERATYDLVAFRSPAKGRSVAVSKASPGCVRSAQDRDDRQSRPPDVRSAARNRRPCPKAGPRRWRSASRRRNQPRSGALPPLQNQIAPWSSPYASRASRVLVTGAKVRARGRCASGLRVRLIDSGRG